MTAAARARRRAVKCTQDALYYLHVDVVDSKPARAAMAAVRADRQRTLKALRALVGTELVRRTRPSPGYPDGVEHRIVVTPRNLGHLRAAVDGLYGLARKLAGVEERVEPVIPTSRPLGCSMASKVVETKTRTWTKWLPWLHVAGVVVYQPGDRDHCSLVALPSLYRAHVVDARAVVKDRREKGFGVADATTTELARRGRWWEPICRTLLDEVSDAQERASTFAAHVDRWKEQVMVKAAAKAEAVLDRIASAVVVDVVEGVADRVANAEARVAQLKQLVDADAGGNDAVARWLADARKRRLNDAERRLMLERQALKAAEAEAAAGTSAPATIAQLGRAALRRAISRVGGGTKRHRNDPVLCFAKSGGQQSAASPPGKVAAAPPKNGQGPAPSALVDDNIKGHDTKTLSPAPAASRPGTEEAGKGVGASAPVFAEIYAHLDLLDKRERESERAKWR
jgi:hypothetical protein